MLKEADLSFWEFLKEKVDLRAVMKILKPVEFNFCQILIWGHCLTSIVNAHRYTHVRWQDVTYVRAHFITEQQFAFIFFFILSHQNARHRAFPKRFLNRHRRIPNNLFKIVRKRNIFSYRSAKRFQSCACRVTKENRKRI